MTKCTAVLRNRSISTTQDQVIICSLNVLNRTTCNHQRDLTGGCSLMFLLVTPPPPPPRVSPFCIPWRGIPCPHHLTIKLFVNLCNRIPCKLSVWFYCLLHHLYFLYFYIIPPPPHTHPLWTNTKSLITRTRKESFRGSSKMHFEYALSIGTISDFIRFSRNEFRQSIPVLRNRTSNNWKYWVYTACCIFIPIFFILIPSCLLCRICSTS